MTEQLLALGDWLTELGVTRVVMEATSDSWRASFYLLEEFGLEAWLVNARDVKHPARSTQDKLDAVWFCKVAERQMLRLSFVPPQQIRQLRDLTRYRVDLIETRNAEKQRAVKLLDPDCCGNVRNISSRCARTCRSQRALLVNPSRACMTANVSTSASLIAGANPTIGRAGTRSGCSNRWSVVT